MERLENENQQNTVLYNFIKTIDILIIEKKD